MKKLLLLLVVTAVTVKGDLSQTVMIIRCDGPKCEVRK